MKDSAIARPKTTTMYVSIERITEALKAHDWFKAVVLSAIEMERHSYHMIREHFESAKCDYRNDVLKNMSLPQYALVLQAMRKINNADLNTIMDINTERNSFVHRATKTPKRGLEADKAYEPLVKEAIRVLVEKLDESLIGTNLEKATSKKFASSFSNASTLNKS
jgi:hypothetical protein